MSCILSFSEQRAGLSLLTTMAQAGVGATGWPADKVGMQVTMEALGTMFSSARNIMSWLADSARAVAATGEPVSWHTPLGLPIVQPYRRKAGPLAVF